MAKIIIYDNKNILIANLEKTEIQERIVKGKKENKRIAIFTNANIENKKYFRDRRTNKNMKDWEGNQKSTFAMLGASNHSEKERQRNDFYATNPKSLEIFLEALKRDGIQLHKNIWECACGQGHLSKVLENKGFDVWSTDLIDRGYGTGNTDFLQSKEDEWCGDILTNPPYKKAKEFVEKALQITRDRYYTIMFLKIQFLEGQERKKLFEKYPPKYVYVNSARQLCAMNAEFDKYKAMAICYCWYIWEKGFKGEPTIRWI